jgi:hypothetical protein
MADIKRSGAVTCSKRILASIRPGLSGTAEFLFLLLAPALYVLAVGAFVRSLNRALLIADAVELLTPMTGLTIAKTSRALGFIQVAYGG